MTLEKVRGVREVRVIDLALEIGNVAINFQTSKSTILITTLQVFEKDALSFL